MKAFSKVEISKEGRHYFNPYIEVFTVWEHVDPRYEHSFDMYNGFLTFKRIDIVTKITSTIAINVSDVDSVKSTILTNEELQEMGLGLSKKEIQPLIKTGKHEVVFTKVNGEIRYMKFTVDPALIPVDQMPEKVDTKSMTKEEKAEYKAKKEKEELSPYLNVFELDEKNNPLGWKKINVETLVARSF